MGNNCYVVGGRTSQETLLVGEDFLCVYDVIANRWELPGAVTGSLVPRSSHKGIVTGGNQLIICGGAGKAKLRMDDTYVLKLGSKGQLSWRRVQVAPFTTGANCIPLLNATFSEVCNICLYACMTVADTQTGQVGV